MHGLNRWVGASVVALSLGSEPASAAARCDRLLTLLGARIADAVCFESSDLTTNNPATTPANDSLAGLPPFAFTPQTYRMVISPPAGFPTPIFRTVPGIQLQARMADDPLGEARILIRLPDDCRLNPASGVFVHFYDNDPAAVFTRWNEVMLAATELGRRALQIRYAGLRPALTPLGPRMAAIRCAARSKRRRIYLTGASIGKARSSIPWRPIS
jgi:hypothetical protein